MILEIITCNDYSLANILSIVKRIILLIQIIVPILLIISGALSLIKSMQNPDEKNNHKKIINSFLAAAVVFFIPLLINLVFQMIGEKTSLSSCWVNANDVLDTTSSNYYETSEVEKKPIILNPDDYEGGNAGVRLNESRAVTIPSSVLKNAPYSNLSVAVVDSDGNVLAMKDSHILREGGSTTKVFTGYAAVKLLDPETDKVVGTSYAQNMPYMGTPDVRIGQVLTVAQAATKDFPGSSNITTANIAIAIGKKNQGNISDKEAYFKGMEIINNFLKESGCEKTKLVSSSGVNYNYIKNKWGEFDSNGISKGEYGITASDLAMITIDAMNDPYFASGIKGRNNNGLFFIKSGTQKFKHGIWGFNYNGKRYYIAALGFNKNKEGDRRGQVVKDIYNWTIKNIINK